MPTNTQIEHFNVLEQEYLMNESSMFQSAFDFLNKYVLTTEHLQKEPKFLINNFLAEQSLSMLFAKGGSGKSYLMLSLSLKLLNESKVRTVLYCDMDNSLGALKRRGLDKIIANRSNFLYIHRSQMNGNPLSIIDELIQKSKDTSGLLHRCLIVLDSIRDFIVGRDMNSDRDIGPVMEKLKTLREAGATIVFLHHTSKEGDGKTYRGSTAFRDSVDISYLIDSERKENRLIFSLELDKDRLGLDEHVAFDLNTDTMELESANFAITSIPEHKRQFVEKIKHVLTNKPEDGINQTALLEAIGKSADDKTARKYLQEFENKFWKIEKIPHKNNATYYYPILPELPNLPKSA